MKKIYSVITMGMLGIASVFAQANPERVLIQQEGGMVKGYLAERVEEIYFDRIEGKVKAPVEIKGFNEKGENGPTITLSVTKTPDTQAYKIAVVPPYGKSSVATDAGAASYMEYYGSQYYYDEFDNAELWGWTDAVTPGAEYTVLTVAYDKYGIACEASRATFTTSQSDVVGNPQVACETLGVTENTCTVKFTPNEDCSCYYLCLFENDLDTEYAMWSPMFGFNSVSDMIVMFAGGEQYDSYTNTWKDLSPGKTYYIGVAMKDAKNNFAAPLTYAVTTTAIGGEGTAEVAITILDFKKYVAASGTTYSQTVRYEPNENVAVFHGIIVEKAAFDKDWTMETLEEYMTQENPMDPYWDMYFAEDVLWNAEPSTTYYAVAKGKNAKGEWGETAMVEFTTPSASEAKAMPRRAAEMSGLSQRAATSNSGAAGAKAPRKFIPQLSVKN